MELAFEKGLIKNIGVSNFSIKKLTSIIEQAKIKPVTNQIEVHPYMQQDKMLKFCKENNILITCYSPIGSALIKMEDSQSNMILLKNELINQLAEKYEKSPAQILLNWGLNRGTILIPKTIKPKRAIENFASQEFEMETIDIESINNLNKNFRYIDGTIFTPKSSPYTLENLWDE